MSKLVKSFKGSEVPHRPTLGRYRRHPSDKPAGRKRIRRRVPEELIVLDLGEDVSSVWSPATGTRSEPSRIAIDADGDIRGFGFDADLLSTETSRQLTAVNVLDDSPARDHYVRSFLAWLIERSVVGFGEGLPVFVPMSPNAPPAEHRLVRQAVEDIGSEALVIHRPLAAAVALDLPVDEPVSHLMAEVSESHIDMAIIRSGSVVTSRRVPRHDKALVRLVTNESLNTLDPDDELEIRGGGVYLFGWSAPRHAATSLSAFDLPLAAPVGLGPTVLTGARVMAEHVLPWLLGSR